MKARLRSLRLDRSRKRMLAAVPRATMVVANPTHYAVAMRYVRAEGGAPIVLAKGVDLIALKIREIAEDQTSRSSRTGRSRARFMPPSSVDAADPARVLPRGGGNRSPDPGKEGSWPDRDEYAVDAMRHAPPRSARDQIIADGDGGRRHRTAPDRPVRADPDDPQRAGGEHRRSRQFVGRIVLSRRRPALCAVGRLRRAMGHDAGRRLDMEFHYAAVSAFFKPDDRSQAGGGRGGRGPVRRQDARRRESRTNGFARRAAAAVGSRGASLDARPAA